MKKFEMIDFSNKLNELVSYLSTISRPGNYRLSREDKEYIKSVMFYLGYWSGRLDAEAYKEENQNG